MSAPFLYILNLSDGSLVQISSMTDSSRFASFFILYFFQLQKNCFFVVVVLGFLYDKMNPKGGNIPVISQMSDLSL